MNANRYINTSNQYLQRENGIPPAKRPKLSIEKQSVPTSNNTQTSSTNCTKPKEDDFFDDIWGNDIDEQVLQSIVDETIAMSQMPVTHAVPNIATHATGNPLSNKCHVSQQGLESLHSTISIGLNENITSHTLKGVPLRKTASSGWPTTSTERSNQSNNSELQRKMLNEGNNHKNCLERNSSNAPNCSERHGTEQKHSHIQRGAPLRRTSSGGWPSANTFSPSPSNLLTTNSAAKPNASQKLLVELDKLNIDNRDLKEKLNIKTGEVNLLRDKLNNTQHEKVKELNKIKKELTDKMNTIRQEAESTINHLTKENKSLKSKLDVEVMEKEISTNKANQESPYRTKNNIRLNVSPRSKQSLAEGNFLHGQHLVEARTRSSQYRLLYELISAELTQPTQPEAPISEIVRTITNDKLFPDGSALIPPKINLTITQKIPSTNTSLREDQPSTSTSVLLSSDLFSTARDRLSVSLQRVSESCASTTVEPCQISSLATLLSTVTRENKQQVLFEVVEKCSHVVKAQLCQLEVSACPRNKCIEREQEVLHRGYKNLILTDDDNLLLSGRELYINERGISARRALALLSVLVEFSELTASQILSSELSSEKRPRGSQQVPSVNNSQASPLRHALLETIKHIVHQIENQRRTLMFEGVLASTAKLVSRILQSKLTLTSESQEQLVQILKRVVFARPGSLVLHYVLQALFAATKYPDITDNLCHNADTCILQVLCVAVQLVETPRKHLLSETYTAWILTLFYSVVREPKWLFAMPAKKSCQCRPLVSRLALYLIGEACLAYPTVLDSDEGKKRLEKLLTRSVMVVWTLLYHDEHFGIHVDSINVGYYELFITSMNHLDISLPKAHLEIMDTIINQEEHRTRSICPKLNIELTTFLSPVYTNPKRSGCVLEFIDSL